jgi:hypothetical protein
MTNKLAIERDEALVRLMRDFGYRLEGKTLIANAIKGWTSDQIQNGTYKSKFEAAEWLISVINNNEYSARFHKITRPV